MTPLVWAPREMLDLIGEAPSGVEVAAIPDDPDADPRVREVEMFVVPLSSPDMAVRMPLADLWRRMPALRYVQVPSAGVDWLVDGIPEGVTLCSARGVHDGPVSEWVMAAVLAGLKRFGTFRDAMRDGEWRPEYVSDLCGATVLLVGYGSIARAVEARLAPFEPKSVLRVARRAREGVSSIGALPELLPEADVVVLLLPLTAETRGLIDGGTLSLMKPGALLVNAARGGLVDSGALLDALEAGRIRAVLDVTDPEPLPPGHPLWRAPELLVTPHIAGITRDIEERTALLVRDQIARFARGEELANQVRDGY